MERLTTFVNWKADPGREVHFPQSSTLTPVQIPEDVYGNW